MACRVSRTDNISIRISQRCCTAAALNIFEQYELGSGLVRVTFFYSAVKTETDTEIVCLKGNVVNLTESGYSRTGLEQNRLKWIQYWRERETRLKQGEV